MFSFPARCIIIPSESLDEPDTQTLGGFLNFYIKPIDGPFLEQADRNST